MITLENSDELEFPWVPVPEDITPVVTLVLDTEFSEEGIFNIGATRLIHNEDGTVIYQVEKAFDMYEDLEISPWLEAYTGITQQDVEGQHIDWNLVAEEFKRAKYVIAHNANGDRKLIDAKCQQPIIWLCSYKDINWLDFGIKDTNLSNLLQAFGYYSKGKHKAYIDSKSTAVVACSVVKEQTVLSVLIGNVETEYRVDFFNTPFETRDIFRGLRFGWDFNKKSNYKMVGESKLPEVLTAVTEKLAKVIPNKDFTTASHLTILPISEFDRHK